MSYEYPPPKLSQEQYYGVLPIDFLIETILRDGLEWFKTDPAAPKLVYGHLMSPVLSKYGESKINEIVNYIKKYDIKIVQHFSLIDVQLASISIQLLDGNEMTERSGLADHQMMVDARDMNDNVIGRKEVGYISVLDQIHLGIHNVNTPDLTKYLYYLVVYIISAFKGEMEERGMMLGTFRATDISRLNDFLPENMYSRFINFTVYSIASFSKGDVPIVDTFKGVHAGVSSDTDTGLTLSDIKNGEE